MNNLEGSYKNNFDSFSIKFSKRYKKNERFFVADFTGGMTIN